MKTKKIETVWETWSYEVNDRFNLSRDYPLTLKVEVVNPATGSSFEAAYPTEKQIREALQIKPRIRLYVDGDDMYINVEHESTGYPLGEMFCISHKSLSPIKEV